LGGNVRYADLHNFCVGWLHVYVSISEDMRTAHTKYLWGIQLNILSKIKATFRVIKADEWVGEGVLERVGLVV